MIRLPRQGFAPCFLILLALAAQPVFGAAVWVEAVSPATQNPLRAVEYVDRTDAWAVGESGTILRLVDGSWHNFASGSDRDLLALAVLGKSEAWAVGAGGTIIHYDGAAWRPDPASQLLTVLPLNAVAYLNADNVWAVGGREADGPIPAKGVVLRYDGTSWSSATETVEPLYDIALNASDDIHICGGNRTLLRFDGSKFQVLSSPVNDGKSWRSMAFPFVPQGWVVGDSGSIARFSVDAWSAQVSPVSTDLFGLAILSERQVGYAVGAGGVRLHFLDGAFTPELPGDWTMVHTAFGGIGLANELEGAAVGGTAYFDGEKTVTLSRIYMLRGVTREQDLSRLRVYPNPYDPGTGRPVTFDFLPADVSSISITTLLGEVVAEIGDGISYAPATGVAQWNGRLGSGNLAASGAYVLCVRSTGGGKRKAVFLVARQ